MMSRSRAIAMVLAATVLAVGIGMAGTASAGVDRAASFQGLFTETPGGSAAGYDIHGSAKMTIDSAGTVVEVHVAGLDPAKVYGSHLHNGTCASGGGGHYQDIEGGAVAPPNELWLSTNGAGLVPNDGGVGHGAGSAAWTARVSSAVTNARSVVVHEPGTGTRIACADLQ